MKLHRETRGKVENTHRQGDVIAGNVITWSVKHCTFQVCFKMWWQNEPCHMSYVLTRMTHFRTDHTCSSLSRCCLTLSLLYQVLKKMFLHRPLLLLLLNLVVLPLLNHLVNMCSHAYARIEYWCAFCSVLPTSLLHSFALLFIVFAPILCVTVFYFEGFWLQKC